jgi:hypothetical protein
MPAGRSKLVCRPRLRARGGAAVAFGRRVAPFYLSCPPRALAAWPFRRLVGVAAASGPGHSAPPAPQLEPFPPLKIWRAGACRTLSPRSSRRQGAAQICKQRSARAPGAVPISVLRFSSAVAAEGYGPTSASLTSGKGRKQEGPVSPQAGRQGDPGGYHSCLLTSAASHCTRPADRSQPSRG